MRRVIYRTAADEARWLVHASRTLSGWYTAPRSSNRKFPLLGFPSLNPSPVASLSEGAEILRHGSEGTVIDALQTPRREKVL